MEKTLIWKLISSFSKKEQHRFSVFLASPYFNSREDMQMFYALLLKYLKKGKLPPNKETLYAMVYEGEEYDDQNMRLLISRLYKLGETFLLMQEVKRLLMRRKNC